MPGRHETEKCLWQPGELHGKKNENLVRGSRRINTRATGASLSKTKSCFPFESNAIKTNVLHCKFNAHIYKFDSAERYISLKFWTSTNLEIPFRAFKPHLWFFLSNLNFKIKKIVISLIYFV